MTNDEKWEIVERSDTWNIKSGKRCIARLQKKVGAEADAKLIVAAVEELKMSEADFEAIAECDIKQTVKIFAMQSAKRICNILTHIQ